MKAVKRTPAPLTADVAAGAATGSTLGKSVSLLETLADAGRALSLSELMRLTGLPKTTCHRLLAGLARERLVQFEPRSRSYRIGLRFMSLAFRTWHNLDVRRAAQDEMQALGTMADENIHLAVPDGNHIVFVDRVESHRILRLHSAIGNRASMHCTALGKAMVASMRAELRERIIASMAFESVADHTITSERAFREALETVRRDGFAIAYREHQSDICGVAASISDFRGEVIGALSISAPCFRVDVATLTAWGPRVNEAAARISQNLGWLA